jgi:hypothetical protein
MSMAITVGNATELLWQQLIHVPDEQTWEGWNIDHFQAGK